MVKRTPLRPTLLGEGLSDVLFKFGVPFCAWCGDQMERQAHEMFYHCPEHYTACVDLGRMYEALEWDMAVRVLEGGDFYGRLVKVSDVDMVNETALVNGQVVKIERVKI